MRRRRGFTLVETMVALALLGVIVVTIVSGFSTLTLAAKRHAAATNLDRLARSDAEYIKSQAYLVKPGVYANLAAPAGYSYAVQVLYFGWFGGGFSAGNADSGFQEVQLTVSGPNGTSERIYLFKGQP